VSRSHEAGFENVTVTEVEGDVFNSYYIAEGPGNC
jgi:hypothetical protein